MTRESLEMFPRIVLHRNPSRRATILCLSGELDLETASALRRIFRDIPSAVSPNVVVDVRRVDFMDCSVLGVLVLAHRRATLLGGYLHIVGAHRQPLRLLQVTGLHSCFALSNESDSSNT